MNSFNFFFDLNLGERLFSHTDILSKTLQKEKMSAVGGQRLAKLTRNVLQSVRNDESCDAFYAAVLIKSKLHGSIAEPALPRKKHAPRRYEIGEGQTSFPATATDFYRRIYFAALGLMTAAIDERFNQTGFLVYAQLECLLVNSLKSEDISAEM